MKNVEARIIFTFQWVSVVLQVILHVGEAAVPSSAIQLK
jgi:hypothetical protein